MRRLRAMFARWFARSATSYAIVDLETTGLEPATNHIVEIAVVTLDARGRVIDEWSSLVCPPGHGPIGAEHIHGISRSMVERAPRFSELCDTILQKLDGHVVVGHVVAFDLSHLRTEFARAGRAFPELGSTSICTRELARSLLTVRPRTLERCCEAVGIPITQAHRALNDAHATAALFARLATPAIAPITANFGTGSRERKRRVRSATAR